MSTAETERLIADRVLFEPSRAPTDS
jgi:hypothetical protein